jgi:hypothetical protein
MMDTSQIGRADELAIELYTLVTAHGEVDIYSPSSTTNMRIVAAAKA